MAEKLSLFKEGEYALLQRCTTGVANLRARGSSPPSMCMCDAFFCGAFLLRFCVQEKSEDKKMEHFGEEENVFCCMPAADKSLLDSTGQEESNFCAGCFVSSTTTTTSEPCIFGESCRRVFRRGGRGVDACPKKGVRSDTTSSATGEIVEFMDVMMTTSDDHHGEGFAVSKKSAEASQALMRSGESILAGKSQEERWLFFAGEHVDSRELCPAGRTSFRKNVFLCKSSSRKPIIVRSPLFDVPFERSPNRPFFGNLLDFLRFRQIAYCGRKDPMDCFWKKVSMLNFFLLAHGPQMNGGLQPLEYIVYGNMNFIAYNDQRRVFVRRYVVPKTPGTSEFSLKIDGVSENFSAWQKRVKSAIASLEAAAAESRDDNKTPSRALADDGEAPAAADFGEEEDCKDDEDN